MTTPTVLDDPRVNYYSDELIAHFAEVYGEGFISPGGWLLASDWMSGDVPLSNAFHMWATALNLPIDFARLSDVQSMLTQCGFAPATLTPRVEWCRQETLRELEHMSGPLRERLLDIHQRDERKLRMTFAYHRTMLRLLDSGEFCPAHIRARKPAP